MFDRSRFKFEAVTSQYHLLCSGDTYEKRFTVAQLFIALRNKVLRPSSSVSRMR